MNNECKKNNMHKGINIIKYNYKTDNLLLLPKIMASGQHIEDIYDLDFFERHFLIDSPLPRSHFKKRS